MAVPWWKRPFVRPARQGAARRPSDTDTILAVSRAVASSLELEQVLETVYEQVSRIFDTANFYIATYEEKTDEFLFLFDMERGRREPVTRHKVEAGLTGYIIRNRVPLLLPTDQARETFTRQQGIQIIGEPSKCWLGVPLLAADTVVGVMTIQSYDQENCYDEQDLALFSTIASQVAVAISNARLYQETRRRAEEVEALYRLGASSSLHLSLEEIEQSIYEQASVVMDTSAFFVALYDRETDEIAIDLTYDKGRRESPIRRKKSERSGLTGWVLDHGETLLIRDWEHEAPEELRRVAIHTGEPALSWLGVPMVVRGETIGVIAAQSYQAGAFDEHDRQVLEMIAHQSAAALSSARLFDELSQRLQETRLLFQASQEVGKSADLAQVLHRIVQACVEAIPAAEKGSLHLLDEATQELHIGAAVGYSQEIIETVRLKVGQGLAGRVVQTGQPTILADARSELRAFRTGLREVEEICAIAAVPVRVRERTIGVLVIDNLHRPGAFRPQDLETLSGFAGQAALAIENANLYTQLRRQVEQLSSLASQVFAASNSAQSLVETCSGEIKVLEEHSRTIGGFVAQLEQFAEQTDLLALNAAIEAARAGAHGLGFAIVADEVRRLAESSARAAGEIATISQRIIAETREAAQRMEQVRQAVEHTTRLAQGASDVPAV
jgi:GAF domain-containing protein